MKKWLNSRYLRHGGPTALVSLSYAALLAMASTAYSQDKVLSLGESALTAVVWSPNGKLIAASSFGTSKNPKKIVVAEIKTEKIVREFTDGPPSYYHALAFSKDSKTVYSFLTVRGDDKGEIMNSEVKCWNIETGKGSSANTLPGYGKFLSERFLVTANYPKLETVNVFDLAANKKVLSVELESRLRRAEVSRDGKYLATSEQNGPVNVWDLESHLKVCTLKYRGGNASRFCFPSKEPTLAVLGGGFFHEMPSGKLIGRVPIGVISVEAISSDGDLVVGQGPYEEYNAKEKRTEKSANGINLYSRKQGRAVSIIKLDPGMRVSHLQFSPDGRFVLAVARGIGYIWEISKLPPYGKKGE